MATGRGMQVVWIGPSVEQAELVRAVLEGQGICAFVLDRNMLGTMPHVSVGIGRGGARVAVSAAAVESARAALEQHRDRLAEVPGGPSDDLPVDSAQDVPVGLEEGVQERRLEDLARRSAVMGLFSMIFPPLVLAALYFLLRSASLRRRERLALSPRARRHLSWAVVGIVLGAAWPLFFLVMWVLSSRVSPALPDPMF